MRILLPSARAWQRFFCLLWLTLGLDWGLSRLNRRALIPLLRYAQLIFVPAFGLSSVLGFSLVTGMVAQMWSGALLALLFVPDPSFVMGRRLDYFLEVWWQPSVYYMHTCGVDLLFALSYAHLLKKIYLGNFNEGDLDGWFTGSFAFLVFHLVVFLGITLSSNHLGDVTVTIAANMFWSLVGCWHRSYALLFGNKHLSVDQLVRFMLAHYVGA